MFFNVESISRVDLLLAPIMEAINIPPFKTMLLRYTDNDTFPKIFQLYSC